MMLEEVLRHIGQADTLEITYILDAAMDRYRALYPEWDIHYFATEKSRPMDPEMMLAYLQKLQNNSK